MELIRTADPRVESLTEYLRLLAEGPVARDTHDGYRAVLDTATAEETNRALHAVLSAATEIRAWEEPVARFLRSVSGSLDRAELPAYPEEHELGELKAENAVIASRLERLSEAVKRTGTGSAAGLRSELQDLDILKDHYIRLQNGLFPLFEEAFADHACVTLMWTLEDKALALRKSLLALPDSALLAAGSGATKALGAFYLLARSLIWREERILYPVAWRMIAPARFKALRAGGEQDPAVAGTPNGAGALFACETGSLTAEQLEALFRVLPIDVSFIGADDRVKFYSDPPHRVFPRTPAVIGRLVQNCHPPKSVATVERILRGFRDGSRNREEFWLTLGDRFIHIEYFALRSPDGEYLGTLEASYDATDLRALQGEKRLL